LNLINDIAAEQIAPPIIARRLTISAWCVMGALKYRVTKASGGLTYREDRPPRGTLVAGLDLEITVYAGGMRGREAA
jgi:hypothetical protein